MTGDVPPEFPTDEQFRRDLLAKRNEILRREIAFASQHCWTCARSWSIHIERSWSVYWIRVTSTGEPDRSCLAWTERGARSIARRWRRELVCSCS